MKSIIKHIIVTVALLTGCPFAGYTQHKSSLLHFMQQYSDSPSYSFVSMGAGMLSAIDKDEAGNTIHSEIHNLLVLSTDTKIEQLYSEVQHLLSHSRFVPLMTVKEDGSNVQFYTDRNNRYVHQLVMVTKEADECVIIMITGNIDMDHIGNMDLPGLQSLKKRRNKDHK